MASLFERRGFRGSTASRPTESERRDDCILVGRDSVEPFEGKHAPPYTIGRNRPTTSCRQPLIWPNEQTSAASSSAGKQFSSVSTTAASFSSAFSALRAFFFLNFFRRSTCNCCFARGVRASSNSGSSSAPFRYRVQGDDRTRAVVDLLFVAVRGGLDLAALIAILHRRHHAAEPLDFAELLQDRRFHRALDRLHAGRTAQHVHRVLKDAGLFEQDRLPVRRETDPFFARRRERLVGAVGVARVRARSCRRASARRRCG